MFWFTVLSNICGFKKKLQYFTASGVIYTMGISPTCQIWCLTLHRNAVRMLWMSSLQFEWNITLPCTGPKPTTALGPKHRDWAWQNSAEGPHKCTLGPGLNPRLSSRAFMELAHECLARLLLPPLLRALCMTIKDVFVNILSPSGGIVVKILADLIRNSSPKLRTDKAIVHSTI